MVDIKKMMYTEENNRLNFDSSIEFSNNDFFNIIEKRKSTRSTHEKFRLSKADIQSILTDISCRVLSQSINIFLIDNKEKKIYRYHNENYQEIELSYNINNESLYLQDEVHYSDFVLLIGVKKEYIFENNYIYRDYLMNAGYIGAEVCLKTIEKGINSSVFAGVIQIEFENITNINDIEMICGVWIW